ncbi:hypothetical protein [Pseudomonas sp. PS01302]|uniref:hypothetical protein n=1 Tax=Pseudomonas sp. PS01302 TaxID=2991438 RepID=UPI00249C2FCF|nr:hypothetical protein [Pseudomonas sp. PS01302]
MTDQSQRLEVATVKAEVGSNILYRFANDPAANAEIPTEAGDIPNLKQVILQLQEEGAEKISFATTIYPTTAAGIAATANGAVFLVVSNEADEIYAVYTNTAGVAVDTGKRALSSQAVEDAMQAATEAADAAQEAADLSTERTARFLAPISTPPTLRDDGEALQIGDRYLNTDNQAEYIYKSTGWQANDSIEAISEIKNPNSIFEGAALIPYDGTTVGDQMLASRKLGSLAAARAYAGSASRVEVTHGGASGSFIRRPFTAGDVDNNGTTLVSSNGLWTLERDFKGCIYPLWFGAAGDGVSNDTEAVRTACRIATNWGLDVSFEGMKRVFIDTNADIRFNCSLHGHGVVLVSNGGIVVPPSNDTIKNMFRLTDPSLAQKDISVDVLEMFEGQTQLTVAENIGNGMLYISSNKQIGYRTSAPTQPLYFAISHSINRGGVLNFPIKTDLTSHTISAKFTPSPQTWVEIEGFTADETSYNNQCLFRIERGLVKVRNNAVQPNGRNTMPVCVNYLFRFLNGINIVFEDNVISGQTTYGGNTYGIVFDNCCDVTMSRNYGRGRDTWGVMETNNVNGFYINDCNLNRLDVHQGMHNFFVRGGVCYGNSVQYGWGSGLLVVEGVTVVGNTSVVAARNDYDGGFDGAIRIHKCTVNYMRQSANSSTGVAEVVAVFTANSLGGVFPIKMADSIEISDICCVHAGVSDILLTKAIQFELASDSYQVTMPNVLMIKNIYSTKGRLLFTISCPWDKLRAPTGGKMNALIEDIDSKPYPARATLMRTSTLGSYVSSSGTFRFKFRNIKGFTQYFGAPGARIAIEDSSVSHIKSYAGGGPAQRIELSNCDFDETTSALNGSTVGELADDSSEVILNGVRVRAQANIEYADAMQGVLIKKGVVCKLPASATAGTAFSGYRASAIFE